MRRAALALSLGGVLATRAAVADPRVDLDRCDALDRVALRRAVDAELAGIAAEKRAAVDKVVVVECPDAVTAHLRLDPAPASGPIARSLDLGDVPGALRSRLVALAVVELVEVGALVAARVEQTPPGPPPPTAPLDATRPDPVDPTPLEAPGTRTAALDGATAGIAAAAPRDTERRDLGPLATRRALLDGGPWLSGRAIAARAGVRFYTAHTVPMLDAGVELVQGALSVGVTGAVGQADDPLGSVTPFLVAGTAALALACTRAQRLEACASGRLTAGLAGATASAPDPAVEAAAATAPYVQVGAQLELAWRGRHRAVSLTLEAGWAEGLIITADDRRVAQLAGVAIVAAIGARL
jgi:hypothetical protein